MNSIIKHKTKAYLILFSLLILFSFKDFYNNKRIVKYNLNINFKNENFIYSKFVENVYSDFEAYEILLDEVLWQRLDQRPALETVETLGYLKNLMLEDKMKRLFLDFLKKQNIQQEKIQVIFNDIVSNMKMNYFITLENGSLRNEIIFKTFYPEYAEKFIEISKKEIDKEINYRLQKIHNTILLKSLNNMKKKVINDTANKIFFIKKILYMRNGENILSNEDNEMLLKLQTLHDEYSKNFIDLNEFFLNNNFSKMIKFFERNKDILEEFYNKPNYSAEIINFNNLISFYEEKITYIQKLKEEKNYALIEKKSNDRFYDLFKIWSDFLMLLLIILIFELILKIKIKKI